MSDLSPALKAQQTAVLGQPAAPHRYDLLASLKSSFPCNGTEYNLEDALGKLRAAHTSYTAWRRIDALGAFIEGAAWGRHGVGVHQLKHVSDTALHDLLHTLADLIDEVGEVPDKPARRCLGDAP